MIFPIMKWGSVGEPVKALQQALNEFARKNDDLPVVILDEDSKFGQKTDYMVRIFQRNNGLVVDGIVGSNTLLKLGLTQKTEKVMPKYLMLHCSATPERSAGSNAASIKYFHEVTLGWGRCGYSRIVEYDGKIVETHPVDLSDGLQPFEITYGALEWNAVSVHICYVGGMNADYTKPKNTLTPEQDASFQSIIREVLDICPDIKILGHNQAHPKACPSFWVPDYLLKRSIPLKNIYLDDPLKQRDSIRNL